LIEEFFSPDGTLKREAGRIDWPFGELDKSNVAGSIKAELEAKVAQWANDPQNIIDNAFVYACMHNQVDAARLLLQKGALIDAIPPALTTQVPGCTTQRLTVINRRSSSSSNWARM